MKKIRITGYDYTVINRETVESKWKVDGDYNGEDKLEFIVAFFNEYFSIPEKYTEYIGVSSAGEKRNDNDKYVLWSEEENVNNVVGIIRKSGFKYPKNDNKNEEEYDVEVTIHSRFDEEKPWMLATMLASGCNDLKFSDDTIPSTLNGLFDFMLVYWFKKQLDESYKIGFYKTYQYFVNNDDRLKGSIDVGKHIKNNLGFNNGKITYRYRENTGDNFFNHLLLHTYKEIKKYFPNYVNVVIENDPAFKSILKDLEIIARSYTRYSLDYIINKNQRVLAHPYFHSYEKLRVTCLNILRHIGVSIFDEGMGEEVEAILFYVPDLWENYCESIIREKIPKDIELRAQEEIKIFGGPDSINFETNTYPDFILYSGGKPTMVIDAKYKKQWQDVMEKTKLSGRTLEDYTKCIRDMNSLGVNEVGVMFPDNTSKKEKLDKKDKTYKKFKISKYNETDTFYTIPIYIPTTKDEKSFTEWNEELSDGIKWDGLFEL